MSAWNSGEPFAPKSMEDWLALLVRRVNDIVAADRGIGRTAWQDAEIGPKYEQYGSAAPGWRKLNDGRIELRGRLAPKSGSVADSDVLITMPYECAPPNNKDLPPSSVYAVAPCTSLNGPGVFRVDITRGPWVEDENGDNASVTHVIARPSSQSPINGTVALEGVIYDPRLYLDALPPVPFGQDPLVPDPGWATMQQPGGDIIHIIPGVSQPGDPA